MCRAKLLHRLSLALLSVATLGCANETWNLDHYRDERAMDIEDRLTREEPIVKNPFGRQGAN